MTAEVGWNDGYFFQVFDGSDRFVFGDIGLGSIADLIEASRHVIAWDAASVREVLALGLLADVKRDSETYRLVSEALR